MYCRTRHKQPRGLSSRPIDRLRTMFTENQSPHKSAEGSFSDSLGFIVMIVNSFSPNFVATILSKGTFGSDIHFGAFSPDGSCTNRRSDAASRGRNSSVQHHGGFFVPIRKIKWSKRNQQAQLLYRILLSIHPSVELEREELPMIARA